MKNNLTLVTTNRRRAGSRGLLDEFGDVLTVEEAAGVLRIGRSLAYDLARMWRAGDPGGLPVIQVGRQLRVPRAALAELIAGAGAGLRIVNDDDDSAS